MSKQDDFEEGLVNRRRVLGDAWVDRSLANANDFNSEFQSLITRFAWNDIWGRPGLDDKTRRMLVLAITAALGRWEEYELHIGAALRAGVPVAEIKEVLMQTAIYAGVPAANTAFKLAQDIMKELGMAPASAPIVPRGPSLRTSSTPGLRYLVQGKGRPVVLSHALGMDLTMWDHLAGALAADCEVLRYDHRGHGQSDAPPGPYSIDELTDDAARLIREWNRGPVTFIGLSMGGMVGQGLATRHPELVERLVIANSTSWYPDAGREMWRQRIAAVEANGIAAIADAVMARYFTADFRKRSPDVEARARETLVRTDREGYLGCCRAISQIDFRNELRQIACPTLVIAGERDEGAPPAMAQATADATPGALLETIADASHISNLERPEEFLRVVRKFVRAPAA